MSAGRFTVFGSATTLRDDFPGAAALFAECFTRPTFPAGRVCQGAAACPGGDCPPGRRSAAGNQRVLLRQLAGRLALSHHSGRQGRERCKKLTAKDLQAYHAKYFVPNNMIVTVFGDIDPEEALALVKKQFGGLQAGRATSSRVSFDRGNAIAKTIVRHKTDRQGDGDGDVRLSDGEHLRQGGLRRDDGAGRDHGGLPVSGRVAAQRAARRGAGVLRPRLADDRARAGLFRHPRPNPARQARRGRRPNREERGAGEGGPDQRGRVPHGRADG